MEFRENKVSSCARPFRPSPIEKSEEDITEIEKTRREVQRIMQMDGLKNPALPSLFKTLLKADPEDYFTLGFSAVSKFRKRKFKGALDLARARS